MQRFESVAIIGVGLIGASIGLAMRRTKLAGEIVGVGRRATSLQKAKKCGAVDRTTTKLDRGVARAELIFVCTPVESIVEQVQRAAAAAPPGALITDAGSTKEAIVAQLEKTLDRRTRFVGSHPLAGSEKSGPQHARADLLDGRTVILTPSRKTRQGDATQLARVWSALGARVVRMAPAEHDRAMAATSHLPHLLASAIADSTPEQYFPLVASGWLDTTRIAAGDPELWQQILLGNRKNVLRSLDQFERTLATMRTALERDDPAKLKSLLTKAQRIRDALGS